MNKTTYQNVVVGTKLLVKPDKSWKRENETEERTVVKKTGPGPNNCYCLTMDNGDEYYGLSYIELKMAN